VKGYHYKLQRSFLIKTIILKLLQICNYIRKICRSIFNWT